MSFLFCIIAMMQGSGMSAQQPKVGDKLAGLPDSLIGDRYTILEFWNINCLSCIRSFPVIEQLQDKFSEELRIVLVSKETSARISEFFTKRKTIPRTRLGSIEGDSVLSKQFDDLAFPFQLWLDRGGTIRAITNATELSETKVNSFIRNDMPDENTAAKKRRTGSLMEQGLSSWGAGVAGFSYVAHCSEHYSVGNRSEVKDKNGLITLSEDCSGIEVLYKVAYGERGKFNFHHPMGFRLDFISSVDLSQEKFSYELALPAERSKEMYKMMQQDLERYFGYKGIVSKQKIKEMELLARPGSNLLASKGGMPRFEIDSINHFFSLILQNQPFDVLVKVLRNNLPPGTTLVDRSYYRELGNIDLQIVVNKSPSLFIPSLRKELERYNLKLFIHEIPMDVLTVTDK